jgi:hypothetical protein
MKTWVETQFLLNKYKKLTKGTLGKSTEAIYSITGYLQVTGHCWLQTGQKHQCPPMSSCDGSTTENKGCSITLFLKTLRTAQCAWVYASNTCWSTLFFCYVLLGTGQQGYTKLMKETGKLFSTFVCWKYVWKVELFLPLNVWKNSPVKTF